MSATLRTPSATTSHPTSGAGWHAEQIKAAIRMRGTTLTQLSLDNGYCDAAVKRALARQWPAVEHVIAEFLGVKPWDLWPERYSDRKPTNGGLVPPRRPKAKKRAMRRAA